MVNASTGTVCVAPRGAVCARGEGTSRVRTEFGSAGGGARARSLPLGCAAVALRLPGVAGGFQLGSSVFSTSSLMVKNMAAGLVRLVGPR